MILFAEMCSLCVTSVTTMEKELARPHLHVGKKDGLHFALLLPHEVEFARM